MLERSITSLGDGTKLRGVFENASRGEPITLGVIGGSITQGAHASQPSLRYASQLLAMLQAQFPKSSIRLINAGLGATGSNYAALRASRDLLMQQPDLVVLEFAVNDGKAQIFGETLEGLVRQVLSQPNQPAAVTLFMMRQNGDNAQERLASVGRHYGLPMVSYRDALWPEIEAGRTTWADISPDEVHPNDAGHAVAAELVAYLCQQAVQHMKKHGPDGILPMPLYTDDYQFAELLEATDLVPIHSNGWRLDTHCENQPGWISDQPGSRISFEIRGSRILLMFVRLCAGFGRVGVKVDDLPETIHDGWFDQTWGGYRETVEIASGLNDTPHRVQCRLLTDRSKGSTGHEFRLLGLGAAGVRR